MEVTKTKPTDYIASLPADRRDDIQKLYDLISDALPGVEKVMWEGKFWGGSEQKIIGFGTWTYTGSNGKEGTWFVVGIALQKSYITVFVNAVESRKYIAEKYKNDIGKAKVGKSTITFKKLEDIKIDVLLTIVKKGFALSR